MEESFAVPVTPPIQGAWDKWMGPGMPGPFEQECWACGLKRDRDHQDFTRLYQEHSDDHHVGLGPGKVKKQPSSRRNQGSAFRTGGHDHQRARVRPHVYRYSQGFLLTLARNLEKLLLTVPSASGDPCHHCKCSCLSQPSRCLETFLFTASVISPECLEHLVAFLQVLHTLLSGQG